MGLRLVSCLFSDVRSPCGSVLSYLLNECLFAGAFDTRVDSTRRPTGSGRKDPEGSPPAWSAVGRFSLTSEQEMTPNSPQQPTIHANPQSRLFSSQGAAMDVQPTNPILVDEQLAAIVSCLVFHVREHLSFSTLE